MDQPKSLAEMTDQELIDEWFWLMADAENREDRAAALGDEMDKRGLER